MFLFFAFLHFSHGACISVVLNNARLPRRLHEGLGEIWVGRGMFPYYVSENKQETRPGNIFQGLEGGTSFNLFSKVEA